MLRYPLIILAAATSASVFASVAVFSAADLAPPMIAQAAHDIQVTAMEIGALAF